MKRKLKKFFAVLSVVLCLVLVNLSLFTVGAAANVVPSGDSSYRTCGSPVSIHFFSKIDSDYYVGSINRPNVYTYFEQGDTYRWYEGTSDTGIFDIGYNLINDGYADIYLAFDGLTNIDNLSIDSPILFSSWSDLDSFFNIHLGVLNPSDINGNVQQSFLVDYSYTFVTGYLENDDFYTSLETVRGSLSFSYIGYGYVDVPLFNRSVLSDTVIAQYSNFIGGSSDSTSFCYLNSAELSFATTFSTDYYIEPSLNSGNRFLSSYMDVLDSRFRSIYEASEYTETIVQVTEVTSFDDISWTDWIVNSVGAFLDFEIIPGLSFAGMLGLLVGMSLFIVFLKIFAGG